MLRAFIVKQMCGFSYDERLRRPRPASQSRRGGTYGAQAILTMRGWDQSDRFDEAWALVAATYPRDVHVLANVVDITPKPERPSRARASR